MQEHGFSMENLKISELIKLNKPQVLVLLGPTAVGKTKSAIRLAKEVDGEIVSCDSRMVYIGMDIGTSKPTLDEREGVTHHLIDVVSPNMKYTVADFKREADLKISDILKRKKMPILVGGTMLYIDAVTKNYNFADQESDYSKSSEYKDTTTEELYEELLEKDPDSAKRIPKQNRRYVIRALDVISKKNEKFSLLKKNSEYPYKVLKIGLTMDKEDLYKRINQRVLDQIDTGLIQETEKLAKKYDYSLPSMTGLGYKQIGAYLRGEISLKEAIVLLATDTRHFAKRQYTWWRRDGEIHWMDV